MSRPCGGRAAALGTASWPTIFVTAVALCAAHTCLAQQGSTWRVSVSSAGVQASGGSWEPSVSSDGRFIAFPSQAANLVPKDTNNASDIFVRNRLLASTERVSVSTAGAQTSDSSEGASISADGRFVAFASYAPNLVAGDSNVAQDIFVRDRLLSVTERVSLSSSGVQANDGSRDPALSADGRFVGFQSDASNLIFEDTNNTTDVFVRDLASWSTTRESVSSNGEQGWVWSTQPTLNYDGRFVAFASYAYNLIDDDTNYDQDIFVRDGVFGLTRRVSVSSSGEQSNSVSTAPQISADGRFAAFESLASNLVGGDTNSESDIFVRQGGPDAGYRVVSGVLDFQHLAGAVPTLTPIEYRLPGQTQRRGYWLVSLTGSGQFTAPAPSGAYDLSAKHTHWLRRTTGFDTTSGDANVGTLLLRNGDVTDSNAVDLFDLTAGLVDFAKTGHRMSDLDESGQVGLSDINIALLNFAQTGDP